MDHMSGAFVSAFIAVGDSDPVAVVAASPAAKVLSMAWSAAVSGCLMVPSSVYSAPARAATCGAAWL
jgi:hypothetical protein